MRTRTCFKDGDSDYHCHVSCRSSASRPRTSMITWCEEPNLHAEERPGAVEFASDCTLQGIGCRAIGAELRAPLGREVLTTSAYPSRAVLASLSSTLRRRPHFSVAALRCRAY
jgi:hypothetical protein